MVLLGTYHVLTFVAELGAGFPLGKSFRLRMKVSLRPPCIQRPQGQCYYNLLYYCSFLKLIKSQPEYAFMYLILKTFTCHVLNILRSLIQVLNWEEHFVKMCTVFCIPRVISWHEWILTSSFYFIVEEMRSHFGVFAFFLEACCSVIFYAETLLYFCNKVRWCNGEWDLYLFLMRIHSSLSKPIMKERTCPYSFLV